MGSLLLQGGPHYDRCRHNLLDDASGRCPNSGHASKELEHAD